MLFIFQNDLKSLEEACDEIALFDEDEQIPYLVGEVFIYQNTETTEVSYDMSQKKGFFKGSYENKGDAD